MTEQATNLLRNISNVSAPEVIENAKQTATQLYQTVSDKVSDFLDDYMYEGESEWRPGIRSKVTEFTNWVTNAQQKSENWVWMVSTAGVVTILPLIYLMERNKNSSNKDVVKNTTLVSDIAQNTKEQIQSTKEQMKMQTPIMYQPSYYHPQMPYGYY